MRTTSFIYCGDEFETCTCGDCDGVVLVTPDGRGSDDIAILEMEAATWFADQEILDTTNPIGRLPAGWGACG
jgi:hypothetical protein